jgi:hypothetical protein
MHNRLRLLRLLTGVLYFGPLLAGLMGQGWAMVPVFVGIFLLWSVLVHPQMWPQSAGDVAQHEAVVALASLVATQALLVVVMFAMGRGIGGVLALKPMLPEYMPAALSFLAVPLARLIRSRPTEVEQAGFARFPSGATRAVQPVDDGARDMVAHLMTLRDDVDEDVVQQHLSAIADHVDPVLIRQHLGEAMAGGRASRVAAMALIVHATDPATSDLLAGTQYPGQAFAAAGRDADLLTLFARRCMMVLEDEPDLASDCPDVTALLQAAGATRDDGARMALNRLAGLLEQGRPA